MDISSVSPSVPLLAFWKYPLLGLFMRTLRLYGKFWIETSFILSLCSMASFAASITINGPSTLQTDLIALTTTQNYNATVTASSFFPGSYTINLMSKKPPVSTVPLPCKLDDSISAIVAVTTNSYIYGFSDGLDNEREWCKTMVIDYMTHCDHPLLFNYSTSTWNQSVCEATLLPLNNELYYQQFSTMTINLPVK